MTFFLVDAQNRRCMKSALKCALLEIGAQLKSLSTLSHQITAIRRMPLGPVAMSAIDVANFQSTIMN